MALAVVATFTNLPEAQVAASALRSGGIDAIVMDEHFGVAMWVEQFALQGFRVAVPGDQLTDARAFFKELTPPRPRRAPPRSLSRRLRALAGALAPCSQPSFCSPMPAG